MLLLPPSPAAAGGDVGEAEVEKEVAVEEKLPEVEVCEAEAAPCVKPRASPPRLKDIGHKGGSSRRVLGAITNSRQDLFAAASPVQ